MASKLVIIKDGKKRCTSCNQWLLLDSFGKNHNKRSICKFHSWCKKCFAIRCHKYSKKSSDKYRQSPKGILNALKDRAELRTRDKEACINMYSNGDACCKWCGIADLEVLCLDHINDDGAMLRKSNSHPTGSRLFQWLRQRDYPLGFQVLCRNCNFKKEFLRKRNKRCGRLLAQSA